MSEEMKVVVQKIIEIDANNRITTSEILAHPLVVRMQNQVTVCFSFIVCTLLNRLNTVSFVKKQTNIPYVEKH